MEQLKDNPPQEEMKTLCVVQLARIGDLIQTYLAVKEIKSNERSKDLKTMLIARKRYAEPLRGMLEECFDEIITVDYEDIVLKNSQENLHAVLKSVKELADRINKNPIHAVVNLTFSKTSGYLSSLINCPYRLGVYYDQSNRLVIKDHWSQFVYSNVLTGPLNPFSLVNIFSRIVGTNPPNVVIKNRKENIKTITIHPFASQERKAWKPNKWSEILFSIFKTTDIDIVNIVGSPSEVGKANELINSPLLERYKNKINNRVGKTSIDDVKDILKKSDLFIGHDSMVGHLASTVGLQTITLSMGSVRPIETAPYGENNYVFAPLTNCFPCFPDQKCEHFKCHSDIPYQAVNSFLTNIINGNSETPLKDLSPFHSSKVQVYKTYIEQSGFLNFEPLINHTLDIKQVFQKIYRITWQYVLSETEEASAFPEINQITAQQLHNYQEGVKHLYQISEFGKKYCTYILQEVASKTPSLTKIKDYSNKITDVDRLQSTIKESYPLLSPVVDYYSVVKSNLEGENIVNITENAYISYENCSTYCSVLNELIEKTVNDFLNMKGKSATQRG